MEGYGPETYGDRFADVYDEYFSDLDTQSAVETLAQLAGSGPVLELAIGTGRLAVPLVERGFEVHGIDASAAMVAKLRDKPMGDRIPVTIGDFADVPGGGTYSLVFLAFSTIFALLTAEDQARCFANSAARLTSGGAFVIEAFVPDLSRFDRGQGVEASAVDVDQVVLKASRHDPVLQRVDTQHVVITEQGTRLYPVSSRYAYPEELDGMAQRADLKLHERWGGWQREPFNVESTRHVSVYRR